MAKNWLRSVGQYVIFDTELENRNVLAFTSLVATEDGLCMMWGGNTVYQMRWDIFRWSLYTLYCYGNKGCFSMCHQCRSEAFDRGHLLTLDTIRKRTQTRTNSIWSSSAQFLQIFFFWFFFPRTGTCLRRKLFLFNVVILMVRGQTRWVIVDLRCAVCTEPSETRLEKKTLIYTRLFPPSFHSNKLECLMYKICLRDS